MGSIRQREFQNLEEAFLSLPKEIQEASERVAEYTELIFILAGSEGVYMNDIRSSARMKSELSDTIRWAAKYYDLGKVLVPELYHRMHPDFTSEELALYQSIPANGVILAENTIRNQGKVKQTDINILLEMIQYHGEKWNGTGYPEGLKEVKVPIVARIVQIAETFDALVMEKHSEKPFEYAMGMVQELSGVELDPVITKIVVENKPKIRRIFNKYKGQSRIIPQQENFVKRRSTRPYELFYRPIYGQQEKANVAYEAELRFRDGKEWLTYAEVEAVVKKNKLMNDLGTCCLLEACDTIRRLELCQIPCHFIALHLPLGWLNGRGVVKAVASVLEDTLVEAQRLGIIIQVEQYRKMTKTMGENLQKLQELGIPIMLSGCEIQEFTAQELLEKGISILRLSEAMGVKLSTDECVEYCTDLAAQGVKIAAEDMDKKSYKALYYRNRIVYASDITLGDYRNENQMVEEELLFMEQD